MTLRLDDLDAALDDDRHLGWGYSVKRHLSTRTAAKLDCAVIDVANELGLDYEELFLWANSKEGRWLVDKIDDGANVLKINVRENLNAETIQTLKEEEAHA